MVNRIELSNFQSHNKTVMDLDPHVNVIVGSSDNGKSSIIRSINWVVYNRPLGDAFVSTWNVDGKGNIKQPTRVKLVHNENEIVRTKTKDANSYELNNNKLKAFGTTVPEDVKKTINFSDLNIQYQTDAPFLLSKTGGEVANILNKIINLEKIDSSLKKINSMKRKTTAALDFKNEELKKVEKSLEPFDKLDEIDESFEDIESRYDKLAEVINQADNLYLLIESIQLVKDQLDNYKDIQYGIGIIDEIIIKRRDFTTLTTEQSNLSLLIDMIEEAEDGIKALAPIEEIDIDSLIELNAKINTIDTESCEINNLLVDIEELREEFETTIDVINRLDKQWKDEAPDVCPLCDGTGKLK